jgi:cell division protein FtsB
MIQARFSHDLETAMAEEIEQLREEIAKLKQEVAVLRARLSRLEEERAEQATESLEPSF